MKEHDTGQTSEVDDVILTAKVQIDKEFLLDGQSVIDIVVVVLPVMVLALRYRSIWLLLVWSEEQSCGRVHRNCRR